MLEPESFDVHINAVALIIVMLDHSEVDMGVLDSGIETMESNDCKEVLEDNRDTNSMLAMI